jgi:hypothetical protein
MTAAIEPVKKGEDKLSQALHSWWKVNLVVEFRQNSDKFIHCQGICTWQ